VTEQRDTRGRMWPWIVVALLVFMASMMGVLFWKATGDPTHVVEPDYYNKAMKWDSTAAVRDESVRAGWTVKLDFRPVPGEMLAEAGADVPNTLVVVQLKDSTGKALTDVAVHLRAYFSARADRIFEADMQAMGQEFGAAFRLGPPGLWEFEVQARRENPPFNFTWKGSRDLGEVK
jgi:hypothetical protein